MAHNKKLRFPPHIQQLVNEGWEVRMTKNNHAKLRHPRAGNIVVASLFSNDWRAHKNLMRDIKAALNRGRHEHS